MNRIRAHVLSNYESCVINLGEDPAPLLSKFGINIEQLKNANSFLSFERVCELLNETARLLNEPLFGVHLAKVEKRNLISVLSIAASMEKDVRSMLEFIRNNIYLNNNVASYRVDKHEDKKKSRWVFGFHQDYDGLTEQFQLYRLQVAYDFLVKRITVSQYIEIHTKMCSRNSRIVDGSGFNFNSTFDGILLPNSLLNQPVHLIDEELKYLIEINILDMKNKYPDNLFTMSSAAIIDLLLSGSCSVELVAKNFGLSVRNYQKQLKEIGTSYSEVLKQTREEYAKNYLLSHHINITELALSLGFSDSSSFSRQFKSWTGMSPIQWHNSIK